MKKISDAASRHRSENVSGQMKAWAAALVAEMAGWPKVRARAFFGYTALYRRDRMFALLPRTRTLEAPHSVAFKLESPSSRVLSQFHRDRRMSFTQMQKARWFTFELNSGTDLREALEWMGRAYDAAA